MKVDVDKGYRVVILNDMLAGGGRERRIVQLITGLNAIGVNNITLILLDDQIDYPKVFDLNVKIIIIKRKGNRDLSVFYKIYKILKELKGCVVNPWSFMTTFYAAPICAMLGLKCIGAFVVDARRPRVLSINWLALHTGFLLCNRVVANSQAGHDAYKTPKKKRLVIYNGFDQNRVQDLRSSPLKNAPVRIAMIGRLDKQKDFVTFVDALAVLEARGLDFNAYIVGQGDDLKMLQKYAFERLPAKLTFTGFVRDIDAFINTIDIGVLCTNPSFHAEGISNALMEIMAQGKPVVATDGGGTPEIVSSGRNGFLIPPNDAETLADMLQRLCEDPELRLCLGKRAAETVSVKFGLSSMALEFDRVYHG